MIENIHASADSECATQISKEPTAKRLI